MRAMAGAGVMGARTGESGDEAVARTHVAEGQPFNREEGVGVAARKHRFGHLAAFAHGRRDLQARRPRGQ